MHDTIRKVDLLGKSLALLAIVLFLCCRSPAERLTTSCELSQKVGLLATGYTQSCVRSSSGNGAGIGCLSFVHLLCRHVLI